MEPIEPIEREGTRPPRRGAPVMQRARSARALRWTAATLVGCVLATLSCEPNARSVQIGGSFDAPLFLTAPTGDPRLFIVERAGTVRVTDADGAVLDTFLDIRALVSTAGEGGLLGMAFSPGYATNGLFYVYYIDLAGDSVLARFRRSASNPNRADPSSRFVVLTVDQPPGRTNHKGGTVAFSPADRFLYWALGDGGGAGDPDDLAQNTSTLLGKVLRLDVSGELTSPYRIPPSNPFVGPDGVPDEIWSIGFRNPFRFSFDRANGDLWIGDVGQGGREEIDYEPAGEPGGRNYGWDVHEGTLCLDPDPGEPPCESPQSPVNFTFPFYEYATHVNGTCSITGGVVYRGSVAYLQGLYLFADFCNNRIMAITPGGVQDFTEALAPATGAIDGIVAFGEDGFGEVYIVSLGTGQVHRIE